MCPIPNTMNRSILVQHWSANYIPGGPAPVRFFPCASLLQSPCVATILIIYMKVHPLICW